VPAPPARAASCFHSPPIADHRLGDQDFSQRVLKIPRQSRGISGREPLKAVENREPLFERLDKVAAVYNILS